MNRLQKARLLKAIQEGKLKPEDIQEKAIHTFFEKGEGWEHDGKFYSETEFRQFKQVIEEANSRRELVGLDKSLIIQIKYEQANK